MSDYTDAELIEKFRHPSIPGLTFADGYSDSHGIAEAVRAVIDNPGRVEVIVIADHHSAGNTVYSRTAIGTCDIDGIRKVRWCGGGDKPDGTASCTVGPADDLARCVAIVACNLSRVQAGCGTRNGAAPWIFREVRP